ncbi:MAG: HD domain-containing protein [Alphaproteobacteria bacterium]|nr:HD domain-containing protein [Alphaproteobacteria bacterium]
MSQHFYNLSLTQRIMGLLAICVIFVGVTLALIMEHEHKEASIEQTRQKALVFLHGIEREIQVLENWRDYGGLQRRIEEAFLSQNDAFGFYISSLTIRAPNNTIIAYAPLIEHGQMMQDNQKIPQSPSLLAAHHLKTLLAGKHSFVGGEVKYFDDPKTGQALAKTSLSIPLKKGGATELILSADMDLSATLALIDKADKKFETTIALAVGVGVIIMLILTWLVFKRWLLKPVNDITSVTTGIAGGDLSRRVETKCCTELGLLSDSINSMADSIETLLTEQESAYLQTLKSLAKALEAKDSYTAKHSARVAKYSVMLGQHIGLDNAQLTVLQKGALMHDLGKIGVPDLVLNKPAKLDDLEFIQMKSHPVMTATIMKPLGRFKEFVEIAAWHHERWDGRGYPDGLAGEEIPLLARIVSIADTWDAMTGDRIYRKGIPYDKALKTLVCERRSGQWDPELLGEFLEMIEAQNPVVDDRVLYNKASTSREV